MKKECASCGMDMTRAADFAKRDKNSKYCIYCVDSEGNLRTRNEIREIIIQYWTDEEGMERSEVENWIDDYMKRWPEWKDEE